MELSRRITGLSPSGSDGWEVFYRARQMIADGQSVTDLTIGDHDIGTARDILDAMHRAAVGGHTGYASVPGTDTLREAVAKRISRTTGVVTTARNVMITPGAQAGLFAAHIAACDPGDTALFLDPYYVTYPGTIRSADAIPKAVITRADDGFQPRAADIAACAKGARSLLINSPNNPTGAVYHRDTLQGIAGVCRDHDLWLICDEVYESLIWEGQHLSPRALPEMDSRTLVVGSMSKSHAMTGSRIGWICGPEEAIAYLGDLAHHTNYGVAGFIQDAACFALSQGGAAEAIVAAPFLRRRKITQDILAGQDLIPLSPTQGAMYAMLDIRNTRLSGQAFAMALLDTEQIAVMPGESFGAAAAGHIRIAMTVEDSAYKTALERILAFARAQI